MSTSFNSPMKVKAAAYDQIMANSSRFGWNPDHIWQLADVLLVYAFEMAGMREFMIKWLEESKITKKLPGWTGDVLREYMDHYPDGSTFKIPANRVTGAPSDVFVFTPKHRQIAFWKDNTKLLVELRILEFIEKLAYLQNKWYGERLSITGDKFSGEMLEYELRTLLADISENIRADNDWIRLAQSVGAEHTQIVAPFFEDINVLALIAGLTVDETRRFGDEDIRFKFWHSKVLSKFQKTALRFGELMHMFLTVCMTYSPEDTFEIWVKQTRIADPLNNTSISLATLGALLRTEILLMGKEAPGSDLKFSGVNVDSLNAALKNMEMAFHLRTEVQMKVENTPTFATPITATATSSYKAAPIVQPAEEEFSCITAYFLLNEMPGDTLISLRRLLQEVVNDPAAIKDAAIGSGLNVSRIIMTGTVVNIWSDVIKEAVKVNKLTRLLMYLLTEYPDNHKLRSFVQALEKNNYLVSIRVEEDAWSRGEIVAPTSPGMVMDLTNSTPARIYELKQQRVIK